MQIGVVATQQAEAVKPLVSAQRKEDKSQKATKPAYTLDLRHEALSRLDQIRAKIQSGYYNRPEVIDTIADRVINIL